jgi:hypothetical protein
MPTAETLIDLFACNKGFNTKLKIEKAIDKTPILSIGLCQTKFGYDVVE